MSVNQWISASIVNLQSILPIDLHHRTLCSVGTSTSETPCVFVSKNSFLLVASTKQKRNLWRRCLIRFNGWSIYLVFRTPMALRCPINVTNSSTVKQNPLDIIYTRPRSDLLTGYFFRAESGRSLKLAFYTVQY